MKKKERQALVLAKEGYFKTECNCTVKAGELHITTNAKQIDCEYFFHDIGHVTDLNQTTIYLPKLIL